MSTYWSTIIIFDNMVDYIRTSVRVDIPATAIHDVLALDQSISYNSVKQELSVQCISFACAVGITYTAMQLIHNKIKAIDAGPAIIKYKKECRDLNQKITQSTVPSDYDAISYKLSLLLH